MRSALIVMTSKVGEREICGVAMWAGQWWRVSPNHIDVIRIDAATCNMQYGSNNINIVNRELSKETLVVAALDVRVLSYSH